MKVGTQADVDDHGSEHATADAAWVPAFAGMKGFYWSVSVSTNAGQLNAPRSITIVLSE